MQNFENIPERGKKGTISNSFYEAFTTLLKIRQKYGNEELDSNSFTLVDKTSAFCI